MHASANDENILRDYRDKYGVEPPAYPKLDLPFSFLFDTIILVPIVLPIVLYQVVSIHKDVFNAEIYRVNDLGFRSALPGLPTDSVSGDNVLRGGHLTCSGLYHST